ncbi:MAG: ATP-grasp domain-containing protein [Pseudoruegeria sp.]
MSRKMTSTRSRGLPEICIVLGLGSASVSVMLAAASRVVRPIFLLDQAIPEAKDMAELVPSTYPVIDITDHDAKACANLLQSRAPKGVVTYSEYALPRTAAIANALALVGHSPETAAALTEKDTQRQMLVQAGVHECKSNVISARERLSPDHNEIDFPVVLKPVTGAGSLHTMLIKDATSLTQALAQMPADIDLVIEEYFQGDATIAGQEYGDYVSVESLHCAGESRQICVTGKLPLTANFRETGMFLPSSLSQDVEAQVLELEAQAINALGVENGITHTEIKLTAQGPRLIEVNGRLGGYVPEILKRASGIDLVRSALYLCMGIMPPVGTPNFNGVTYQVFLTPEDGTDEKFKRLDGLDEVDALEGVAQIEMRANAGDRIHAKAGTQSLLGIVYGYSTDHPSFCDVKTRIAQTVSMEFSS